MSELLFFILGLIIGGLVMTTLMCCLQINRINEYEKKNNPNKKDRKLIKGLEELYLNEYYDYNFEQFFEEIEEKYNISYSVMLNEFKKDDIISPLAHKETLKLYNEKMKKAIHNNIEGVNFFSG